MQPLYRAIDAAAVAVTDSKPIRYVQLHGSTEAEHLMLITLLAK